MACNKPKSMRCIEQINKLLLNDIGIAAIGGILIWTLWFTNGNSKVPILSHAALKQ